MNVTVLKGLLASSLLVAGATAAQAQISFGPRVGLNLTNHSYDLDGQDEPSSKAQLGAQVGVALNAQFGNFAVQPALIFTMKGDKLKESENETYTQQGITYTMTGNYSLNTRLNYIELPVNFVYSTQGAEGGFQVFAGPYLALGVGGRAEYDIDAKYTTSFNGQVVASGSESESDDVAVNFTNKEGNGNNYYRRKIDAGFNFGVGYKAGPVQAQLGYGLGLSNVVPNYENGDKPEDKTYNRGFQLALTYFFE